MERRPPAALCFIGTWNALLQPLVVLGTCDRYTLSIRLSYLSAQPLGPRLLKDHLMMAAAAMTTLPILVIFFGAQRYFVRGIVTTGIKAHALFHQAVQVGRFHDGMTVGAGKKRRHLVSQDQ